MSREIHVVVEHLQGLVADITYVSLAAARALAGPTGAEVVGLLLGHQVEGLAADLAADRVVYVDDPALGDFTPLAVLFGDTSMGAELAGILSGRLQMPLVGRCQTVRAEGEEIRFVSQICGGKIFAETSIPESTVLVTMVPGGYKADLGRSQAPPAIESVTGPALGEPRVVVRGYREPEVGDVDITTEGVLVAIGRGIQLQDNVELAQELAEALGGAVCASRPIIDQGRGDDR